MNLLPIYNNLMFNNNYYPLLDNMIIMYTFKMKEFIYLEKITVHC